MMNGEQLGREILAAIDALSEEDKGNREKVFAAMGKAIVAHIQANAQVLPGITVQVDPATHAGATTGTGRIA